MLNLQGSSFSTDINYLNFALWRLAFGEPDKLVANTFPSTTRADDLNELLALAEELRSCDRLREKIDADPGPDS